MPTIISHSLVGLAFAQKAIFTSVNRKRLLLAAMICAALPDIDYIGLKLGIQYASLFGHRGFTHSFFFAGIAALIASRSLLPKGGGFKIFSHLFLLFFVVTASHPILDAMTDGGEGVAFFSPFSNHRYFFFYRPIMVSPIGFVSFFTHLRGPLVLIDEILLILIPLALVLYAKELWRKAKTHKIVACSCMLVWIILLIAVKGLYPLDNMAMVIKKSEHPIIQLYVKQYKNPEVLKDIPAMGVPGGKLVTDFWEMEKLGLFNRRLETDGVNRHWSSGFFPSWYGGIAGRWQDSHSALFLRTVFGFGVASAREVQEILKESRLDSDKQDFLFKLSPTEKYDLALGDYAFTATKSILAITHDAVEWPKYWYGICNGMAAASKWYLEPTRNVDVINPNGFRIRFHPNDVKALLGYSMANVMLWTELGVRCGVDGPEADSCRTNAGAFFIATMNRIGLAHDSFVVDGFSSTRKQFYLFDAARIDVVEKPRPVEEFKDWALPTQVKYIAKVRMTLDFVSTLLSDQSGERRVGRVAVPRVLEADLALNDIGEIIGGAWTGDEDVPDVIFFPASSPAQDAQGRLKANSSLNWPVIKRIYDQSVSDDHDLKPIDLSI